MGVAAQKVNQNLPNLGAEAPVQQQKVAKPNVVILATGGTIAGSAASNTQTRVWQIPANKKLSTL